MCKHMAVRKKGKTAGTDAGGGTEKGTAGRQSGRSGRGRGTVRAGNGRGTAGPRTSGDGGRGGITTCGRGGVATRGREAVSSPNSTGSPGSVGSKCSAASPVDRGGGDRSKRKAILCEGGGRSGTTPELLHPTVVLALLLSLNSQHPPHYLGQVFRLSILPVPYR